MKVLLGNFKCSFNLGTMISGRNRVTLGKQQISEFQTLGELCTFTQVLTWFCRCQVLSPPPYWEAAQGSLLLFQSPSLNYPWGLSNSSSWHLLSPHWLLIGHTVGIDPTAILQLMLTLQRRAMPWARGVLRVTPCLPDLKLLLLGLEEVS